MNPRDLFSQQPKLGAYLFTLLFVFSGVFSFHGDLFGKTTAADLMVAEGIEEEDIRTEEAPLQSALPAEVIEATLQNPRRVKPLPPQLIDTETLWLARCMFSETKRPEEQELVGWVVRNRVETRYRGQHTYQNVVLDDYQFSAFNPGSRKRRYYSTLTPYSQVPGWQRTLTLAYAIRHADASKHRPFSTKTRHFYSEQSMKGQAHPNWAAGLHPVKPARPVQLDERRFRFFANVY